MSRDEQEGKWKETNREREKERERTRCKARFVTDYRPCIAKQLAKPSEVATGKLGEGSNAAEREIERYRGPSDWVVYLIDEPRTKRQC